MKMFERKNIFLANFPAVEDRSLSDDYKQNNKQKNEINYTVRGRELAVQRASEIHVCNSLLCA